MRNICSAYSNSGSAIIIVEADCWVSIFVSFSSIELSGVPLPFVDLLNIHPGVYKTAEQLPLSFSFSPTFAVELGSGSGYCLHTCLGQEGPCQMQPESLFKSLDIRCTDFEAASWRPFQTFVWNRQVPRNSPANWNPRSWVIPPWGLQIGHKGGCLWTRGSHLWCQDTLVSDNQLLFISNNQIANLYVIYLEK